MHHVTLQNWLCHSSYCIRWWERQGPLLLNTLGFAGDQLSAVSQIQIMQVESKAGARLPLPQVFLPYKPGRRVLPQIKCISNCWNVTLVFWHPSTHSSPVPLVVVSVQLGCKCRFQGLYICLIESCQTDVLHPNNISVYSCLSTSLSPEVGRKKTLNFFQSHLLTA